MAIHLALFIAAFASWSVSTLSAGGGSLLLVPAVAYIVGSHAVAPVVTLASLFASPARIILLWRNIAWRVVRWYLPGAIGGAVLGGWGFTWIPAEWLSTLVGLFLVSTVWQYKLGERPRSFAMRLPWFLPVSFASGLISALVGASGLLANPFYLNYGLMKEQMIATRAVNSVVIQLAKLATYATFGALGFDLWLDGVAAGAGAVAGIWLSNRWLRRLSDRNFRQFAVSVMVFSGLVILWQQRGALLELFRRAQI